MKKLLTLLFIVILSCFIGAIYGIVHDQLTYSISPEYYTKFKFNQFGLAEDGIPVQSPRLMAVVAGIMATWWMGYIIGAILGLVGLIHKDSKQMFTVTMKAILITMVIAFITGLIGLLYGYISLESQPEHFSIFHPDISEPVIDIKSFEMVGLMHNFSYLGGLIGMIAGIVYSIFQKRKISKRG